VAATVLVGKRLTSAEAPSSSPQSHRNLTWRSRAQDGATALPHAGRPGRASTGMPASPSRGPCGGRSSRPDCWPQQWAARRMGHGHDASAAVARRTVTVRHPCRRCRRVVKGPVSGPWGVGDPTRDPIEGVRLRCAPADLQERVVGSVVGPGRGRKACPRPGPTPSSGPRGGAGQRGRSGGGREAQGQAEIDAGEGNSKT